MKFDIHSKILPIVALAPQTITATTNSASIDLQGANSLEFLFMFGGTVEAGTTVKLQESSDNSNWVDVSDPGYSGGSLNYGILIDSSVAVPATDTTFGIGYVGNKRYVRAVVTTTGTSIVGIVAVKGNLEVEPGQLVDKVPSY